MNNIFENFVNKEVFVEFTPRRTVSGVLRKGDTGYFVKLGVKYLPVTSGLKVSLVK
jgi:small nuclear ribonucleoprotein (snRNP)-like protein